uniref:SFRICE_002770 n=1 Tax=Spodoptera frugiperda TaxID=7108 RepID=A0A2H1W8R7_SPOFR
MGAAMEACSAASPPLEPPGVRPVWCGLLVCPNTKLRLSILSTSVGCGQIRRTKRTLVTATSMAPAPLTSDTHSASWCARTCRRDTTPSVCNMPRAAWLSFATSWQAQKEMAGRTRQLHL